MILFDEIKDGDLVCRKSVRLDGHYSGVPYEQDGMTFKKGFTLVESENGYTLYLEGRRKPVDNFEVKSIKEGVDLIKKHYDFLQFFERLKQAGYAVTWHKILDNTILGGTHTEMAGGVQGYVNSFTVEQDGRDFIVIIHEQLTEQKASTEEEVLNLLRSVLTIRQ